MAIKLEGSIKIMSTSNVATMPGSSVELELGGKTYFLRYNFKSFMTIEKKTGRSVTQITDFQRMTVAEVRTIVTSGIRTSAGKEMSEYEVGALLWLGNLPYVLAKVSEALVSSLVKKDSTPAPLAV